MAVSEKASTKPDYGLDAPHMVRRLFSRGLWTLAIGAAVFFVNRGESPGPAQMLLAVLATMSAGFLATAGFMVWSSRVGKLKVRDRLLDALALEGDEKVLDVGCGRGLMAIGAAKRLKTGKVTGIDLWSAEDLSGNSVEAAKENAKVEGIGDKVRFENGDARKLVYPDGQYDVVVSSLAIHNIGEREGRAQAVREMYRVLKPRGRLLIFDIFHAGQYAQILRECEAEDVALSSWGILWCVPARSVMARK